METDEFVLPDVAFPKLKKVIITFFRAHRAGKTELNTHELVAFSKERSKPEDWITSGQASGSNSFLCQLGILKLQPKSKYKLTDLGQELGKSLRDNVAPSSYWAKAIDFSPFLSERFNYLRSIGDLDQLELQKEIVAKIGREPSEAALRGARVIIDIWEAAQYIYKEGVSNQYKRIYVNMPNFLPRFITIDRITSLRTLSTHGAKYNLSKLIEVCEAINFNYLNRYYSAVGILVRVILDHIPPIFGMKNFAAVASNYGGTRSFKESAESLDKLTRIISNRYLHEQISDKDESANPTQISFQGNLDILLQEVIDLLNKQ